MIDVIYVVYVIAAMAVVTFALRALPFLAAPWLRKYPVVQYLGRFLPLAIMTLLLLHSLVGIAKDHDAGPWPELLAAALVMLLQWKSRNPLLSIVTGTTTYVALRNMGML